VFYRTAGPSATGSAAGSEPPLAGAVAPGVPAGMLVTPVPAVACPPGRAGAGVSALCTAPGLVETRFSLLADLVVL